VALPLFLPVYFALIRRQHSPVYKLTICSSRVAFDCSQRTAPFAGHAPCPSNRPSCYVSPADRWLTPWLLTRPHFFLLG
jgi:hypothetical protein